MTKPLISFIAPSHRTHLWKNFYDSIITNLPFEVIFVSDVEPKEEDLPKIKIGRQDIIALKQEIVPLNFNYIISPVKPAQCFEIAYRKSHGEFIIWTGDDFIYSPYAIDNAFYMYRSFYDHKVMISFDVFEDGEEQTKRCHKVHWNDKIQLTTSALISKKAIEEVGGLADINFVAGHWDVDLQIRIYNNGGRMFICPNAFAYEPHRAFHKIEANFAPDWANERDYFTMLWKGDKNSILPERKKPFEPYSKENILIKSQGNKGKWI